MKRTTQTIQTGLEVFLQEGLPQLQGQRVGLVTNYSGVDKRLRTSADLLATDERVHLCALFGPEHGIRGDAQAGIEVGSSVDQRTGLPVHSLYGQTHRPTAEMLQGLDTLIYDIQDVGARYYTDLATLAYAQEAAAEAGLTFVVLDRPNPISGTQSEGNILDPAFSSLVGIHPLPTRHGLTVGELARLFAAERHCPPPLVIPMRGWQRSLWFDETDLPWIYPSPNLPTLDSITLYPGTCLLEGTNISEGRGTTRPFELVGAPWLDPFALRAELEQLNLPGVAFRPAYFTPTFSKHAQILCKGVQMHITDRQSLRPVELGLHLLATLRRLQPDSFTWITGSNNRYFVDRLFGSDQLRHALDSDTDVTDWSAAWNEGLAAFKERSRPHLLYA
ncbi:MAG: exo-beta-N-acetylmuramidase NamZ family protein [Ktedonobacteraceae bacterium]